MEGDVETNFGRVRKKTNHFGRAVSLISIYSTVLNFYNQIASPRHGYEKKGRMGFFLYH